MQWKEEQSQPSLLQQDEYWLDFHSTHIWFGPHSPIHEQDQGECEYLHIFFPTK